jgi:hypothetical protein
MAGNSFVAHLIIRPAFDEPSTATFEVMIVVMAMPASVWFGLASVGLGWFGSSRDRFVFGKSDGRGEVV